MKRSVFHRLSSILWGAIVMLVVMLAVYVSVGRTLASLTGAYQQEILQQLNGRAPFSIDADKVRAEWHSFTPVLILENLRLASPGQPDHVVALAEGRISIDVAGSLSSRSLQLTRLSLAGLNLAGELGDDGQLRIRGFSGGDNGVSDWLEKFLLNVERLALDQVHLALALPDGEVRGFDLDLALSREGSRRRLDGQLFSSRGLRVSALAEGVGNPFEPGSFQGQLYLDARASDIAAIPGLLGDGFADRMDGSLEAEAWVNWKAGAPSAELRLEMRDLVYSPEAAAWQLPLSRLALEAALVERKGGWGLSVAALELASGEILMQVPRLQLDLLGDTVSLRAVDLPVAPLGNLLASMEGLPPAAVAVLKVLQPSGTLSTLQVNITDVNTPAAGWHALANFHEIAVSPWEGAPGVTGASGFVELSPGTGRVMLDSKDFTMAFPTVYAEPLRYDDFRGDIGIRWDKEAVVLSSGLVEAVGAEGSVPVLFGLSIPLIESSVGLEMDLLVGLENSRAVHRAKYIPYILDHRLRSWLDDSIGDGLIEQGGFLWRGSLTAAAPDLHTVQLFFNLQDAALNYHPSWPALAGVNGTVLIDDSNVSVWADSARLLDSAVAGLSVELSTDESARLWLAADATIEGPAADGLAVVNTSPLSELVGGVFTDWQLTGALATDLQLMINLSDDRVPPEVAVSARLSEVDLDIQPGNLPLRDINGLLEYSTGTGFSSDGLAGQLWGKPVQAAVSRRELPAAYDGAVIEPGIAVEIASSVEMDDLRDWLRLDALSFGRGSASADIDILVATGKPPILTIDSDLRGVDLDLPAPWGKPAGVERPLHAELTLGPDDMTLAIELSGGLASRLAFSDGVLRAGSLAFSAEAGEPAPGAVRISGRLAEADTAEWYRFIAPYFTAERAPEMTGAEPRQSLSISVDQLRVDRLSIEGRELGEVVLGLADDDGRWRVSADTDWLSGQLLYTPEDRSQLLIRQLDLAGLDRLMPAGDDEPRIIEVPDLAVSIADLRMGDTLLGKLDFDLHSEGPELRAENIVGEVAALQLRAEEPGGLVWQQGDDSRTSIEARLHFDDLARTLTRFGYQEIVVTESGVFDLALDWPGGPQDISLQTARGSLGVEIGSGHFPDVPGGASGTLRVVSILNLAEIVRRLSLSHMFESGIPFSRVNGEVYLHAGTIEVAKMDLQGSGSSFQFSGVSTVESRSLDGELVVTLPVANNLPWVAALTAGLPVAAGVFVLSKVFESQVNRLTSAVYATTGTWDDPQVTFDRVFDDTRAAPAAGLSGQDPPANAAQPESP